MFGKVRGTQMSSGRSTKAQFTYRCSYESKARIEEAYRHYQQRLGLGELSMNLVKEKASLEWAEAEMENVK